MKHKITQEELLIEYFNKYPNKDIPNPEVVDWVMIEYKKRTKGVFRDPDRGIRKLAQSGFLIKVAKGIYRYDPTLAEKKELEDFSATQKKLILERDGYKCAFCGKGRKEGVELHIDHIRPKDLGGKATLENGQILCSQHNFLKKNLNQTTTGKKIFINLYNFAKKEGDQKLLKFCTDILNVFEEHDINGHIEWER